MEHPRLFALRSFLTKAPIIGCLGYLMVCMLAMVPLSFMAASAAISRGELELGVLLAFVMMTGMGIGAAHFLWGMTKRTAQRLASDVRTAQDAVVVRAEERARMAEQGGQLSVAEFAHQTDGGLSEVVAADDEVEEVVFGHAEDDATEEERAEQVHGVER